MPTELIKLLSTALIHITNAKKCSIKIPRRIISIFYAWRLRKRLDSCITAKTKKHKLPTEITQHGYDLATMLQKSWGKREGGGGGVV